ncbi:MAG: Gfo/Idh/MocA family oxidoreductase [Rhizobiaceae bacterium]|nr:Gfo/Idh/MocA family oxidoreductase [Rhizobiaceae bacterium]
MKWGVVGASTIAAEHMIGALRGEGGTVAWVMGSDARRVADYASMHAIPNSGTDLDALLADTSVDAVYISSTNEKHLPQAMAAIAAGRHVLCEKPLAMTVADAAAMVSAAAAKGVVLGTNHHLRNAGSHMAIRALVRSGRIGRVLSVRVHHAVFLPPHLQGWRINDASAGGGVIADITVHDADTVRFHLGEDPVDVVAMAAASGMGEGVEDSVMSVWSMPSGAQVFAHESFTHAHAGTGIELHGTEGSIIARGVMTQRPVGEIELVTAAGRHTVPYSAHNLYAQAVKRFVSAAYGEGEPAATGVDGVKSLAVAAAVKQAADTGRRVAVGYGI